MKSDHKMIKQIEKRLWSIEANNVVRMAELEWQINQEGEEENE